MSLRVWRGNRGRSPFSSRKYPKCQSFLVIPVLAMVGSVGLRRIAEWIAARAAVRGHACTARSLQSPPCGYPWRLAEFLRYEGSCVSEIGRTALGSDVGQSIDYEFWRRRIVKALSGSARPPSPNSGVCAPVNPVLLRGYAWLPNLRVGCTPGAGY